MDRSNSVALDFVVFRLVMIRLHCGREVKSVMIFDVNVASCDKHLDSAYLSFMTLGSYQL